MQAQVDGRLMHDRAAFVANQLKLMQLRLRAAIDRPTGATGWPTELLEAEAAIAQSADAEFPIRWLRERLGLTETEERVLWVLIAHDLCATSRELLRSLNTENVSDPTTEALRRAVYCPATLREGWRELSAEAPLRRLGLIERTDSSTTAPEYRQTWRVATRVVGLVYGDSNLDLELTTIATHHAAQTIGIGGMGLEIAGQGASEVATAFDAAVRRGSGMVIVQGKAGTGRRSLLVETAAQRNVDVLDIECAALAKDETLLRRQLRLINRECRLLKLVPLLRNLHVLTESQDTTDRVALLEQEFVEGIVLATTSRPLARRWQQAPRIIELGPLTGHARATLWARALPMVDAATADGLATMYPLAPALICAASKIALEQADTATITFEHINIGLRAVLDDRLAGLATRVTVSQSWSDIVLPPEQNNAVVDLLARVRERRQVYETWGFAEKVGRGLGVTALFSGPPGTGKTMCAGLVARDLGTEIYQVDLSKIVSKWIGETEKNLASLFDAAEAGHAILLFDEADTLFGKRTDVKSSNDRYANQETNYLLQRLESFAGICILTTNHDTAIDEAFRRRLSVHVKFPMPEIEERKKLWAALLPKAAPVADGISFETLAHHYEMTGGYIRNAVLRAAFLAASEQSAIGAQHLALGAQLEYQAMGRVIASYL